MRTTKKRYKHGHKKTTFKKGMFHRLLSLKDKVITFIIVTQERKKSQITQEHETCYQTFMFYDTPE